MIRRELISLILELLCFLDRYFRKGSLSHGAQVINVDEIIRIDIKWPRDSIVCDPLHR